MGTGEQRTVAAHQQDLDFLGMSLRSSGGDFTLTRRLARHDGRLYGGTALFAALTLAEEATGRSAIWSTVQFISGTAAIGDRIACDVEVLAAGRRTSQVRVTARTEAGMLFTAMGANAMPKDAALEGTFEVMPDVPGPDESDLFRIPVPAHMRQIENSRPMEMRIARESGQPSIPGVLRFWMRLPGLRATPAVIGFLADMVPMGVVHGLGHMGGGTSLDNTLRVGHPADCEWVLLDLDPHAAVGGFGHGSAKIWSPDGVLVATASQTASLIVVD